MGEMRIRYWARLIVQCMMVACVLGLFDRAAQADLVVVRTESGDTKWFGRVVEQTKESVVFDIRQTAGYQRRTVARTKVQFLVVSIDHERLRGLSPKNLVAYRDLAEELSQQSGDIDAQELAIRLLIITAHWASQPSEYQTRISALKNLQNLYRTSAERQKFATLGLLYGLETVALKDEVMQNASADGDDLQMQVVLKLVRSIRRGQIDDANRILAQSDFREIFEPWRHVCSWSELSRMTQVNRPSRSQLERLLTIELDCMSRLKNRPSSPRNAIPVTAISQTQDWAKQSKRSSTTTNPLPRIVDVTEFDPRLAIFRNGEWIAPR